MFEELLQLEGGLALCPKQLGLRCNEELILIDICSFEYRPAVDSQIRNVSSEEESKEFSWEVELGDKGHEQNQKVNLMNGDSFVCPCSKRPVNQKLSVWMI